MSRLFGIAGIQMSVVPWEARRTVEKMGEIVHNVVLNFPWIKLLMFHELAVPGFVHFITNDNQNASKQNAESIPGPLTDKLCQIARENRKWLIPGSMYETEGDRLYNTAIVISPDGEIVARYRKMFPWLPYERDISPGDQFCVFDIPGVGRFGFCICYDVWYPEVSRTLAWMGAEVILQSTLTPTPDRELELVLCRANAIFNQAFFISVNGIESWGGGRSIMINPDGRVLQEAGVNQTILTEIIDLDHVRRTREYGTLGLAQILKQLRDSNQRFPPYENGKLAQGSLEELGQLVFHQNLE